VTGLWDEYPGLKSRQGQDVLSMQGVHGVLSPGVESSCEADHPPHSNVKV